MGQKGYLYFTVLVMVLVYASSCRQKTMEAQTSTAQPQVKADSAVSTNCTSDTMLPNGNQVLFVNRTSGKKMPLVFIQGIDTLLNYEYDCDEINSLTARYYSLDKNSVYLALGVRQRFRELIVCHRVGKQIEVSKFESSLGLKSLDVFVYKVPGDTGHVYFIDRITAKTSKFAIPAEYAVKTLEVARPSEHELNLEFTDGSNLKIALK
jgi:hypothetical protein